MHNLQSFPSRDALFAAAADKIEAALRAGVAARGRACAALSGGSTPEPVYALLATRDLEWSKIAFAFVDERFVAPDHPASNEAMLRRALKPALDHGAQVLPLFGPGNPSEAAARADEAYAALHLDIALMGMGADGHTASWFVGARGLAEALDPQSARSVVALHASQAAGSANRLSLSLAAVLRANEIVLLITGAEKRAALEAAARQAPTEAPVAALLSSVASKLEVLWAA